MVFGYKMATLLNLMAHSTHFTQLQNHGVVTQSGLYLVSRSNLIIYPYSGGGRGVVQLAGGEERGLKMRCHRGNVPTCEFGD